jgi:hypothetical protein
MFPAPGKAALSRSHFLPFQSSYSPRPPPDILLHRSAHSGAREWEWAIFSELVCNLSFSRRRSRLRPGPYARTRTRSYTVAGGRNRRLPCMGGVESDIMKSRMILIWEARPKKDSNSISSYEHVSATLPSWMSNNLISLTTPSRPIQLAKNKERKRGIMACCSDVLCDARESRCKFLSHVTVAIV